jgi:chromosomal replication initiation ATPase DnaA
MNIHSSPVSEYAARRARLGLGDPPKAVVYRQVPRVVPVAEIVAKYRVAFDSHPPEPKPLTAAEILQQVCTAREVTKIALRSGRRFQQLVHARHEIMWRVHHETSLSYPQIGRLLGGMDHASCIHGVRKHQARIDAGEVRP